MMPTENERKYVLKLDCQPEFGWQAANVNLIYQGYLVSSKGISLRVRLSQCLKTFVERHYMTFKYTAADRVIEVEKKINKRDFEDLWAVCMNKLEKIRYEVADESGQVWEIDFFKDYGEHIYFAMAELEMPEGQIEPVVIPSFIADNLFYAVPLTDTRFASKLLADVRYANQLYQLLKENSNESRQQVV